MKSLIFFMLLLLPIISFGQKTKKKSFKYKRSKILKEEFHVLKRNKNVKHGSYKSYYYNGNPKEIGNYNNGLKDGKWIVYRSSGSVNEVQFYKLGEKTGIWEKHIEKGRIIKRYDHTEKRSLKSRFFIQLDYPETARKNEIEGVVRYKLILNSECEIERTELVKSLGFGCDEEAKKAVEKLTEFSKKYDLEFQKDEECDDKEIELDFNFRF
jgi:hypothetical protein